MEFPKKKNYESFENWKCKISRKFWTYCLFNLLLFVRNKKSENRSEEAAIKIVVSREKIKKSENPWKTTLKESNYL